MKTCRMRPRRWLLLFAAVLLLLTACGAATPAHDEPLPRGGELRWGLVGVDHLVSLDPAYVDEQQALIVVNLIYGGLLRLDENLLVQPDGAESWRVSDDGTTYTFTIREGLVFADGTPVSAEDFAFSLNRALTPTEEHTAPAQFAHIVGAAEVLAGRAESASGIRVVDARTLEIALDEPQAYFLSLLTFSNTAVVPRHLIEAAGDAWTEQGYGTGPFRIREWTRDGTAEEIVLEANPHYWRGQPGIDTIRMPMIESGDDAFTRYQQGDIDIMGNRQTGVPAARVSEVQDDPDFRSAAALAVRYIGFNNRRVPFDNASVRQAFALAIDRKDLAQNTLADTVAPAARMLPAGLAGSDLPVSTQAFNPEGARSALRLAGYLSGQDLPPVTLTYGEEGDNARVAQALQADWRDTLGVEVQLDGRSLAEFSRLLDATYAEPAEGIQMYLSIWGADYPDPQNFLSQQLRSGSPNNNGHWSNDEFDRLVDEADRMGGQEQRDDRLKLYNQAEQIALDQVGWLPLYNPRMNILMRPTVQGLVFTPQGIIATDWTAVRLDQTGVSEQ